MLEFFYQQGNVQPLFGFNSEIPLSWDVYRPGTIKLSTGNVNCAIKASNASCWSHNAILVVTAAIAKQCELPEPIVCRSAVVGKVTQRYRAAVNRKVRHALAATVPATV